MTSFSTSLIAKALDGLAARQIATAQNIANASTANYRPMRVSFERALADAARAGDGAALDQIQPRLFQETPISEDGDLRVDLELGAASSTAMRYAALIEVLNRQFQLNEVAIKGNS